MIFNQIDNSHIIDTEKQIAVNSLFRLYDRNMPSINKAIKDNKISSLVGDKEYYMCMVDLESINTQSEDAAKYAFSRF